MSRRPDGCPHTSQRNTRVASPACFFLCLDIPAAERQVVIHPGCWHRKMRLETAIRLRFREQSGVEGLLDFVGS